MKHFLNAFTNITFTERVSRKEFWIFYLFFTIFYIVAVIFDSVGNFYYVTMSRSIGIIQTIYTIVLFIPAISMQIKRLHDVGKSGGWLFISLVPVVGLITILIFLTQPSKNYNNPYRY